MLSVWRNWAGTCESRPSSIVRVGSAEEVVGVLANASGRGETVRPVGAGHSFSPLVPTNGIILDLSGLATIHHIDAERQVVSVGAGATIAALGAPLWEAGLSLKNQGAIDLQTIGGATGTSTHGSGLRQQAISGAVLGAQLVTAEGKFVELDATHSALPALRAAMGTLGVVTRFDLQVQKAYKLAETIEYWELDDVMHRWDEQNHLHRHFSFVWGRNYEMSADLPAPPADQKDSCLVRIYDEVDVGTPDSDEVGHRVGPAYRIYPDLYPTPWEEVEYFVPYECTHDLVDAIRPVIERHPDDYPVELRTVAADDSWLSPMYRQDSTAVGFCRTLGRDNSAFFAEIESVMAGFGGRPHWGKQPYFLPRSRLSELYPRYEDFVELRRRMDPRETLLNQQLALLLS